MKIYEVRIVSSTLKKGFIEILCFAHFFDDFKLPKMYRANTGFSFKIIEKNEQNTKFR